MDDTKAVIPVIAGELVAVTTGSDSTLVSMGIYPGAGGAYEIFGVKADGAEPGPLVDTGVFKLYVAKLPTGQIGLMKINSIPEAAAVLEREARILRTMQAIATALDNEAGPKETPYYGAQFPNPVESLAPGDGRFVMFLGYHSTITTYRQLVPISVLVKTQRVDLKSIQWMLGKLLKLLAYVHSLGFSVGLVDASNELVETTVHGVFVLDFSNASEEATDEECLAEVASAAKIAWLAAGGSETNVPPYDPGIMSKEGYEEYIGFLQRLTRGETEGASVELTAIYEMADRIWPKESKTDETGSVVKRPFHLFATYPR